ncbi:excinuclease [Cysteiniphilum sp. QT6929]|uniref:excinuclease n=1 Tax=Cysteiniphilum sp. QT6929 TaxID=2975055 RepID=UPI0024B33A5F|nr:excinuclease [Cysteiniphilum sp. QT6929]WHN65945.1 excinuclease [Cysteiniphilum sp. QT6929]
MKRSKLINTALPILVATTALAISACSSNTGLGNYNINQAMNSMPTKVKTQTTDFKFYFGKNSAPTGAKDLGEITTSRRANAFAKDPVASCNWVFYSALLSLENQAKEMGGNGVANIQSNWKNNTTSSTDTYVCENGLWMSGVALKGNAIKQ